MDERLERVKRQICFEIGHHTYACGQPFKVEVEGIGILNEIDQESLQNALSIYDIIISDVEADGFIVTMFGVSS